MKTCLIGASMLTQERLKELLHYNPDTGVFTWKTRPSYSIHIGDIAGCVQKKNRYIVIRINKSLHYAHRLAFLYMNGCTGEEVDHIDHNPSNNSYRNLRIVSHRENLQNRSMSVNNSSGHTGVTWFKRDKKWHSQINIQGRNIHLGYFDDISDAIKARSDANIKYSFHKNHGATNAI